MLLLRQICVSWVACDPNLSHITVQTNVLLTLSWLLLLPTDWHTDSCTIKERQSQATERKPSEIACVRRQSHVTEKTAHTHTGADAQIETQKLAAVTLQHNNRYHVNQTHICLITLRSYTALFTTGCESVFFSALSDNHLKAAAYGLQVCLNIERLLSISAVV